MERLTLIRALLRSMLVAACLGAGLAKAQITAIDIPGYPPLDMYDPREVAMLPSYCKYAQLFRNKVPGGNDPAMIARWTETLSPMFPHIHHYCWGLMKTNRALLLARDGHARQFYLDDALHEYDYVLEHAKDDFVLLPEILTKRGINLVKLQRGAIAVFEFDRAIQLRPDYWPAYAEKSDYFKSVGQTAQARQILEEGLKHSPGTRALTRRLAELGEPKGAPGDGSRSARH